MQFENQEYEIAPSQINLKSFRKRDRLACKIWDGEKLSKQARLSLMDIADDFWEYCNIRWVKPEDVILTGSICNYNWSTFSDIDLHLVVDFKKVHKRTDFVQEYFDDKKNEWNNNHSSLKIFGFPVELYVQDINAEAVSGGVYDLWEDKWLKMPSKYDLKPIKLNKYAIKDTASKLMTQIDDYCETFENETDKHKIEVLGNRCEKLCDKIKAIRAKGLKQGEMGTGNIVYKCLRRSSYLDKLWDLMDKIYDKLNSVD